jgi:hypothetical protein
MMDVVGSRRALPLVVALMAMVAVEASAQTLPWPTDAKGGTGSASPAVLPSPIVAPPMPGAPSPMAAPPMPGAPAAGDEPPCLAQFTKLRLEREKRGDQAKAGRDRKVSREELCKLIQSYATAEAKWVKFTEDNTASCGIPPQVAKQLKEVHARTLVARKQICSSGPLAGGAPQPATPSLSDALGTTRLPVPNTTSSGFGTMNTLTGNAIAR